MKKSFLNKGVYNAKSYRTVVIVGLLTTILLLTLAFAHHYTSDIPDWGLFVFSLGFGFLHLLLYGIRASKKVKLSELTEE